MNHGDRWKGLQAVAPGLFVLLWSTGFIGAKWGLPYAEPLTFLLLRFAIVICLLGVIALALRRPWPSTPGALLHTGVAGVMIHGGYLSGVFGALHGGMSAGVAALIVGMQPLLIGLLSGALLGERVSRTQAGGLLLGVLGVFLVVYERMSVAGISAQGVALACLALASITLGTLYQKRYCAAMDLWSGSVVQFVAAALVLAPFALATETMQIRWSGQFVFALAWLVLVLSLGAISLLHLLIKRGAATRVAALFYLTPPTTALMAFAIFGERLSALAVAGMLLAVYAVWLVVRR